MRFYVYYRASDGEIFGWGNGFDPVTPEGLELAFVDGTPDPLAQRFDMRSQAIVDKTAEERRLALLPTRRDVEVAIYRELCRTDPFMLADYPVPKDARLLWEGYRQMLRELSKHADAAEMIDAWSLPPDGNDPIPDLRERLKT